MSAAVLSAGKTPPDVPIDLWLGPQTQGLTPDGGTAIYNNVMADYIDGLQNVTAVIQGGGNFRFLTQSSTRQPVQRTVDVNFGAQAPNAQIPFFPTGASEDQVNILEAMLGYPIGTTTADIASLHPTQSTAKLVRWGWQADGYYYRLGYGSDFDRDGVPDTPPVIVTCVEPSDDLSAPCTKWTMAPAAAAGFHTEAGDNVADGTAVYWRAKVLKGGNEGSPELIGYYVMPFSETFTRK